MADGKWIDGLGPELPLLEAARRVLLVRLEVVRDHLPRVIHDADKDPEHVHQLRVATRRAGAALRIFGGCLPERALRRAKRRLRALRRAAGEARDWDVFLIDLAERAAERPSAERPGLDFLIGFAVGRRAAVQPGLELTARQHGADFTSFVADVVATLRPPQDGTTLIDLARPTLAQLRHELHEAAAGDLTDYAHLHQVRIAGKRLRYALEVFADCFAPAIRRDLYPQVEEVQEVLGRANDSHVADGRLAALRDRLRHTPGLGAERYEAGIEALHRFHRRRLPQERRAFLKWWDDWRSGGGELLAALTVGAGQVA
jgi:CHAD domain-containing protein